MNQDLRAALERPQIDRAEVPRLFESAKDEGIAIDTTALEFAYRQSLERVVGVLTTQSSLAALEQLRDAASFLPELPFTTHLWKIQNIGNNPEITTGSGAARWTGATLLFLARAGVPLRVIKDTCTNRSHVTLAKKATEHFPFTIRPRGKPHLGEKERDTKSKYERSRHDKYSL